MCINTNKGIVFEISINKLSDIGISSNVFGSPMVLWPMDSGTPSVGGYFAKLNNGRRKLLFNGSGKERSLAFLEFIVLSSSLHMLIPLNMPPNGAFVVRHL